MFLAGQPLSISCLTVFGLHSPTVHVCMFVLNVPGMPSRMPSPPPYSEIDSLRVISMRCMLSDVSVQHSQLLLASVPKYLACEINHLAFLLLDEGWIAYRVG